MDLRRLTSASLMLLLLAASPSTRGAESRGKPPPLRMVLPSMGAFGPMSPLDAFVHGDWLYVETGSSWSPVIRMKRPRGRFERLIPERINRVFLNPVIWNNRLVLPDSNEISATSPSGGTPRLLFPLEDTFRLRTYRGALYRTTSRGRVLQRLRLGKGPQRIARFPYRAGTLCFEGDVVYTSFYKNGLIVRQPLKGGRYRVIVRGQRRVVDTAIVGDYIYWSAEKDGEVRRRRKSGRGKIETVATGQINAEIFVVHQGKLYWRNWAGGDGKHSIMRYDPAQKIASVAVGGLSGPSGFTFDERYLYIAEKSRSAITRVAISDLN